MKAWYYVVLSNNKDAYVLAEDDEEAAWRSHEHAVNCGWKLIDVIPNDKEKALLS